MGTTDHFLIWIYSQQTGVIKNGRVKKLYEWRMDKLETEEELQHSRGEMTKNVVIFFRLCWEV